jgi:hypothetical protein
MHEDFKKYEKGQENKILKKDRRKILEEKTEGRM